MNLIPGSGRSPGGGHGNPFQYSCLETPINRGAWQATVHRVAKSWAWLSDLVFMCSVQFSSVSQLCLALCDPMNSSTPGLPVHHQLLEFTQTHVHRVGDAIQPSHPLPSPSPPAPNPSQHRGLFQRVNSSHEVAKVLEFQLQHQSFQWTPRTELLQDGLAGSPYIPNNIKFSQGYRAPASWIHRWWCSSISSSETQFDISLSSQVYTCSMTQQSHSYAFSQEKWKPIFSLNLYKPICECLLPSPKIPKQPLSGGGINTVGPSALQRPLQDQAGMSWMLLSTGVSPRGRMLVKEAEPQMPHTLLFHFYDIREEANVHAWRDPWLPGVEVRQAVDHGEAGAGIWGW